MTKKSIARIARDAEKARTGDQIKDNSCWDDLNAVYQGCSQVLHRHCQLSNISSNKELIAEVKDMPTLISNLRMLGADLTKMNLELKEIHDQHVGKSGSTQDPDEVMLSINIFEQYNLFMERHDAVVMPTAHHIVEQINQAEHALHMKLHAKAMAERAVNNATDVSVVTDVEIISEEVKPTNTVSE